MKKAQTVAGDDLYSLAEKHLGDHKLWRYVAAANGLGVFDEIKAGLSIDIPEEIDIGKIEGLIGAVRSGENLSSVAKSVIPQVLDLSGVKGLGGTNGKSPWQIIDWIL